ncbi:MAG: flotillin family protein [Verrucomicrobia bacterium]|nr:flotillin family protein [Verrucomicrobiota bacterium]
MNSTLILAADIPWIAAVAGTAALLFVFFIFAGIWASRYTKVGPNEVLVVSGRKYVITEAEGRSQVRGFRLVKGGGVFVWPVFEQAAVLSLAPLAIDLALADVRTRDGGAVELRAETQVKIKSDDESLTKAAECVLGKTADEIKQLVRRTLESALSTRLCGWTRQEIARSQREVFATLRDAAAPELAKLGLEILSFNVLNVATPHVAAA